jgi:ABC-2 type transport system ATP-binding protein
MTTVEVKGVSVALDGRPVLTDLRLVIAGGSRLGLIGPNGSGKTTLLRAIAGLIPYKGEIRVGDAAGGGLSRRELARRIAMVPQSPVVPAGITVTEYVLLGRTPYIPTFATESRRDLAIVASVLDHLDLTGLATRRLDSISGGERQRAVLARALAQQAPVLLLDEPTTGLDPEQRMRFRQLLAGLGERRTVVLSTHLVEDVAAVCTRVVVLWQGRARFCGTPSELRQLADGQVWSSPEDGQGAFASWRTETGAYRVLGERPSPAAEAVAPTVEDGYLLVCARSREEAAA